MTCLFAGRSYREDKNHAEMCNFKKDAYLDRIGSRYRSSWKKNLIRKGLILYIVGPSWL